MRVAALYDIHGNLPALEAVIAEVDSAGVDAIVGGGDHTAAFDLLGVSGWRDREPEVQAAYGGFAPQDLYPDALAALDRDAGRRSLVVLQATVGGVRPRVAEPSRQPRRRSVDQRQASCSAS